MKWAALNLNTIHREFITGTINEATFRERVFTAVWPEFEMKLKFSQPDHVHDIVENEFFEAFERVIDKAAGVREGSFSGYVYRALILTPAITAHRKPHIRHHESLDDAPLNSLNIRSAQVNPETSCMAREIKEGIEQALLQVKNVETRRAYAMRLLGGNTHEEIAEALGGSVESVKSSIHRASLIVKHYLAQHGFAGTDHPDYKAPLSIAPYKSSKQPVEYHKSDRDTILSQDVFSTIADDTRRKSAEMYYLDGRKIPDIAEELGVLPREVRAHLRGVERTHRSATRKLNELFPSR